MRSGILENMSIDALIMFIGAFVAMLPFLGFPVSWDSVLLVIAGVLMVFLGIIVRRRGLIRRVRVQRKSPTFVESVPERANGHEAV